jgi:hypothetical protein
MIYSLSLAETVMTPRFASNLRAPSCANAVKQGSAEAFGAGRSPLRALSSRSAGT